MSEIDAVLCEQYQSIHVIYTDLFCFQASTALCIYVIYANSWINTARPNIVWIQSGNPWAVQRRQTERGMALSAIEEVSQWGVVGCSGSRTVLYCTIVQRTYFTSGKGRKKNKGLNKKYFNRKIMNYYSKNVFVSNWVVKFYYLLCFMTWQLKIVWRPSRSNLPNQIKTQFFTLDRWRSCVHFLNFPFRSSLKRSSLSQWFAERKKAKSLIALYYRIMYLKCI